MERDKFEEDVTGVKTDEETGDVIVDHQRLARLVARSEPPEAPPISAAQFSPPLQATARPRKAPPLLFLALGIIGLLILIVGSTFFLRSKSSSAPTPSTSGNNNRGNNTTRDAPLSPEVKSEQIDLPAGTFQMGRTGGAIQEGPPYSATIPSFAMDRTEVTNAEYAIFVRETNHEPPSHWGGKTPLSGQEQLPVANVSLDDAKAFAIWRTKHEGKSFRLPTETEWEYAARGGDLENLFPWGNNWISGRTATRDAGLTSLQPVGSYPEGKARWGHLDMIGNVWEWTSSKASYYPGSEIEIKPMQRNWVVIRGGSLASNPSGDRAITNAYRDWVEPTTRNDLLGFRLVREGN